MKQAKDQPRTVVFILLCCGTLSDDQLDAVGPRDVGDAAVVGAVPQPHVGDEQLAGGHRDNLRRGHGVIIIIVIIIRHHHHHLLRLQRDAGSVLGSEHAAVPCPVQRHGRLGHVRDAGSGALVKNI